MGIKGKPQGANCIGGCPPFGVALHVPTELFIYFRAHLGDGEKSRWSLMGWTARIDGAAACGAHMGARDFGCGELV